MISFPPPVDGEPIRVSASSFMTFRRCPRSAQARFDGVYGPESIASFRGGLAHRVFARHLGRGEIPDAGFEQACREEIGAAMNPKLGGLRLKPSALKAVISEVGEMYQRFRSMSHDGFRSAEVNLTAEPSEGVELVGTVDAVFDDDGGHRLVDWKTGSLGSPEDQLGFYALLWALEEEEVPSRVEAVSVATGERYSAQPSRTDLEDTAAAASTLVSAIRTAWASGDRLETVGGPWCGYCPLLDGCSEGRAATAISQGNLPGGNDEGSA